MPQYDRLYTADDLLQFPDHELDCGHLVRVMPPSNEHGILAGIVGGVLREFARPRRLGKVTVESGYVLREQPDTVRGPDVSFQRSGRPRPPQGFFRGAPDLAIEILSPGDRMTQVRRRTHQILEAGCPLVWLFNSKRRTVRVYRQGVIEAVLRDNDILTASEVLPGFAYRVGDFFDELEED